jgi:hypothetical protein
MPTALNTIESTAKIKSEKRKHDEYEVSLGEEKVLEGIQHFSFNFHR